ncbi:hypothetical protein PsorP6_012171 [Peronosclerospora sorghi]|uniref:Uncharacterized protein n=1 Tax=Peronosclerospora sorghi TaxID=230839 RepID=A0ACC0WIE7_9STRA|nr:hypothetical protein PsorP6_012171 [Peronosclerospora sorghi]
MPSLDVTPARSTFTLFRISSDAGSNVRSTRTRYSFFNATFGVHQLFGNLSMLRKEQQARRVDDQTTTDGHFPQTQGLPSAFKNVERSGGSTSVSGSGGGGEGEGSSNPRNRSNKRRNLPAAISEEKATDFLNARRRDR